MSGDVVRVDDATGGTLSPSLRARIEAGVRAALDAGPPDGGERSGAAEISLTLISPAAIRELNARFHHVDEPTDVLAFDLGDAGDPSVSLIGDVYICPAIAAEHAREHGETTEREIVRLAVHGALHLQGHDHPEGPERYRSEMFRLQERLIEGV
ncbi:MAG: rRNA maturation RNase YbeY [Gemmatimonadota bacterium]|nr:rRNA maturation RNase YbeY [Gemmatimonadota bacterium]